MKKQTTTIIKAFLCFSFLLGINLFVTAQTPEKGTEKLIPYGDFNSWMVRIIDESFVIGGNTKILYEVAPVDTIRG